eukprot:2705744-Rhodomonas_salina.1
MDGGREGGREGHQMEGSRMAPLSENDSGMVTVWLTLVPLICRDDPVALSSTYCAAHQANGQGVAVSFLSRGLLAALHASIERRPLADSRQNLLQA